MKLVTAEEMIDFVSFDRIDPQTLANASAVTTHIRTCSACLRRVNAFQMIYDELKDRGDLSALPQLAQAVRADAPAPQIIELLQTAVREDEY